MMILILLFLGLPERPEPCSLVTCPDFSSCVEGADESTSCECITGWFNSSSGGDNNNTCVKGAHSIQVNIFQLIHPQNTIQRFSITPGRGE